VPLYLAVSSPRIHRLAGRIADGAIVLVGVDPSFLRASRRELETGAGARGLADFRVVCWTPCSIQADGAAARRAVKAHVARVLKRRLPFELDDEMQAVATRVRERYAYYEHMRPGTAHGEPVPDALVERFAIAGTPAEAEAQLRRLAASGLVDEIALIPHTSRADERAGVVRAVGAMVPGLAG
jgi:5,10-methylenetetrahydromethanopterin reductase